MNLFPKHDETLKEILADLRSDRVKTVILDTDTNNEIDDQYALTYCYLSDKIDLLSVCAAPYYHFCPGIHGFENGMLKSYDEIIKVLSLTDKDYTTPVYHGSRATITDRGEAIDSPACDHIIETVKNSDERIYILAIGAITNVASALLKDPSIKDNMVVIWLGATDTDQDDLEEFNLSGDFAAGQVLINSGVPLLLCPAFDVVVALKTDIDHVRELSGKNKICDYLVSITEAVREKEGCKPDWKRVIWDIACPAIIEHPECAEIEIMPAPVFTNNRVMAFDNTRPNILFLKKIDRDIVFDATWKILKAHKDKE